MRTKTFSLLEEYESIYNQAELRLSQDLLSFIFIWNNNDLFNLSVSGAASCVDMLSVLFKVWLFLCPSAWPCPPPAAADAVSHLSSQGEEGEQGSTGDVGTQGPTVRHCVDVMTLEPVNICKLILCCAGLSALITGLVVISGLPGDSRSHRNDGYQGRGGNCFYYF